MSSKKLLFLISLLITLTSLYAQPMMGPVGHLNIFSENGDKFYLMLNGEQINDEPQSNLRVEDLNQPYYSARIRFEDGKLKEITRNDLMITDGDGTYMDVTYKIRRDRNKKSKVRMNYFSSVPVRPDFIPPSNMHVIHYGQPRPPMQGQGVNANVNVGGLNFDVRVTDRNNPGNIGMPGNQQGMGQGQQPMRPRCNGIQAMSAANFGTALATVKNQSFDETKLSTAKQIAGGNCLNVGQIMQIAELFGFEENKLDFAMFAYDYCVEPAQYFRLNNIFNFSANVEKLNQHIRSRQQ
jgi:hypothetical protein